MHALQWSRWSSTRSRRTPSPAARTMLRAPDIEVPVQVEVLVSSNAWETLRLPADVALDVGDRRGRVHDGEAFFHRRDVVQRPEQLVAFERHQLGFLAVDERARDEALVSWIRKRDGVEPEPPQQVRQPVIVDEPVHRHTGEAHQAMLAGEAQADTNPLTEPSETAISLARSHRMTIDGHQQRPEASGRERLDVL